MSNPWDELRIKKATMTYGADCDHPGCNEHEDGISYFYYPHDWETVNLNLGDPDVLAHLCPKHKDRYCTDQHIQRKYAKKNNKQYEDCYGYANDGCGEFLNKYGLCNNCEATEEETEKDYNDAWGFDKKASENSFVCDRCCYDHHIKNMNKYGNGVFCEDCFDEINKKEEQDFMNGWGFGKDSSVKQAMWDDDNRHFRCDECHKIGGKNGEQGNSGEAAKKGWKFGYGLIYCPGCWQNKICHNCWEPKLDTIYDQCKYCEGDDKEYEQDYNDAWGFNKKASTFHHCDHEDQNGKCKNIVHHDDYDELDNWYHNIWRGPKDDPTIHLNFDNQYCPEHKGLHCSNCEMPLDIDSISDGYDECFHCHDCEANKGKYGQCKRCEPDEDWEDEFAQSWKKKEATIQAKVICDHMGCDKEYNGGWGIGTKKDLPNDWARATRDTHPDDDQDLMADSHFCPDHKDLHCVDEAPYYGCGYKLHNDGTCGTLMCTYRNMDRHAEWKNENDFMNAWTVKEAISYFSLDQPNEAIMPGMAQDTGDTDGLGFGSTPNPDPGKDGMATDAPSMQDYERGLSSAASKLSSHNPDLLCFLSDGGVKCPSCIQKSFPGKDIEHDKLVDEYGTTLQPIYPWDVHGYHDSLYCDNCSEYILGEDTCGHCEDTHPGPNMHWDNEHDCYICPPCAGYNTFCPRCKSWKEGEYGQCLNCDGSDKNYEDNFSKAWLKKRASFEKVIFCDGCNKPNPNLDEYTPRGWGRASLQGFPYNNPTGENALHYDESMERHFCPECKKNKHLDTHTNDPHNMTFGCGEELGEYGQCQDCDGSDEEIENDYSNAWK